MFKKIWPNGIKSDEGYSIKRADRFELEYTEGDKKLLIEVEPGADLAIYSSTIKQWQPPYDSELISEEKKQRIIKNITSAMDFGGWKYAVS